MAALFKLGLGLIFGLLWGSVPLMAQSVISLGVNEEQTLELHSIAKAVDLGNASIVGVEKGTTKATLYLKGLRMGETSLKITFVDGKQLQYQVKVGSQLSSLLNELRTIKGIKSIERNGQVYTRGKLTNKESVLKLKEIKSRYPGLIVDETEGRFASDNAVVNTINRVLAENDLGNFQAQAYGRIIVLEGSPSDQAQADFALRIARMIHPEIEDRLSKEINGGPAISIEVMFVEVSKDDNKTIGLARQFGQAKKGFGKNAVAGAEVLSRSGSISGPAFGLNWQVGGLSTFLNLTQTRTFSRVLANPKLIARSGTEARFHSGHTIYLKSSKVEDEKVVQELVPVDSGIILSITPKIDPIGQIDSAITTGVSELQAAKEGDNPMITKSEVKTAVTIRDGQTIMLSGLVRKKNSKEVDRVPVLSDIPVLGELFKSRTSIEEETEMIILVTMNRVQADGERTKAAGHRLWSKSQTDVQFNLHD